MHIPEGVAHDYRNVSEAPAAMLVLFMPAGQAEHFFAQLGVPVTDRTKPPPPALPDPVLLQKLLKNSQVQIVPLPEEGS